jgi:Asp-tRNA(Asn)/Glu-tRNA(Gln) amidotransferase A subunit family amidase
VSYHLDHTGPMARTAGDLWILLQCLVEDGSGTVPIFSQKKWDCPLPERQALSQPPRLGFLEKYLDLADPLICETTHAAVERLRRAGAQIEPVPVPAIFDEVLPMHRAIMAVEAAEYHREQFLAHKQQYGPKIAGLLEKGLGILGIDYAAALAWQRTFRRCVETELFAEFDTLIMPSTENTAPGLETTGKPLCQAPWSLSGVPAVSIPCGLAADGMPAGLQLIGRPHQDFALLRVAAWCEQCLGFDKTPPLMKEEVLL